MSLRLFKRASLRQVLVASFVLPLVLSVGLVEYISWRNQQKAVEELVWEIQDRVGNRIQAQLKLFAETPLRSTELALQSLERGELNIYNLQPWGKYLHDNGQAFDALTFFYVGNEFGDYVEFYQQPGSEDKIVFRNGSQPTRLLRISTDGSNRMIDQQQTELYDPRVRPWYQLGLQGEAAWSEPYNLLIQDTDVDNSNGFTTGLGISFVRPFYVAQS